MKTKLIVISLLLAGNLFAGSLHRQILFRLEMAKGSDAEKSFIERTMALAKLPSVERFIWMDLAEGKQPFTHGLCIVFKDEAARNAYVKAPEHAAYLKEVWKPAVKDAQLTDYTEAQVVSAGHPEDNP